MQRARSRSSWRCSSTVVQVLLLLCCTQYAVASNWAQLSGDRVQNFALPYEQAASRPLFSPREGLASTTYQVPPEADRVIAGKLFVLGGDDYSLGTDEGLKGKKGGYVNDVWVTAGVNWSTNTLGPRPIPQSLTNWTQINPGRVPPPGVTYTDWISCQPALLHKHSNPAVCADTTAAPGEYVANNMWSPRRGHQALMLGSVMYVLGGRARALEDLPRERAVGGILSPRIEPDPFHASWRETSTPMNDVWASSDFGATWHLVTAGCRDPQLDLVVAGGTASSGGQHGTAAAQCSSDGDCWGVAVCTHLGGNAQGTCVCPMWSPREGHKTAVHGGRMYVVGGFASVHANLCGPVACGDTDAGSHRHYLRDVWSSADGANWQAETLSAGWPGRGDHALVLHGDTLLVLGGTSGGDAPGGLRGPAVHLNDIWTADLSSTGAGAGVWSYNSTAEWSGRGGHAVVLEPAAALNAFTPRMVLVGGHDLGGIRGDTWSWGISGGSHWAQDYSSKQPFRSATAGTTGYVAGPPPQVYYANADSPLSALHRVVLPLSAARDAASVQVTRLPYADGTWTGQLASVGLHTVRDLAAADKYTILRLRGFDTAEVPLEDRLTFTNICDLRALAIALVAKCALNSTLATYPGEGSMPAKVKAVFGGPKPFTRAAQWYGQDFTQKAASSTGSSAAAQLAATVAAWDGCSRIAGVTRPNVPGFGKVDQVAAIRPPWRELQELTCRSSPAARTHFAAQLFEQGLVVVGGRSAADTLLRDAWVRDDRMPTAFISSAPQSNTPGHKFHFTCDERVCVYEVRLYDLQEHTEVLPWTAAANGRYSVSWLSRWKGGSGAGMYVLYVRAIDPAGNADYAFREGLNMHTWRYVSPIPWGIVLGVGFALLFLLLLVFLEYRRRRKRRAMRRYAIKRMRRKFKQQQRKRAKDADWRELYDERDGGKSKGKKHKKSSKSKKSEQEGYTSTGTAAASGDDKEAKKKKKKKDRKATLQGVSAISTAAAKLKGSSSKSKHKHKSGEKEHREKGTKSRKSKKDKPKDD